MSKTILILGASYAGLNIAHSLLKRTLTTVKDYKVILVSPTSHHYHNIASVRAIIPGQFADEKVFGEIAPGFKHYPEGSFQFILGAASSLDPTAKTVTISTTNGEKVQPYDILVIATGTRTIGEVPWKSSLNGYEHTRDGLHKIQDQIKAAQTIVVGGAGPTGVETAAELAFEYGKTKEITLITAGKELLVDSMPTNIAQGAENTIKKMHVNVLKGVKITGSAPTADGKTELSLSDGTTKTVDLYLPTIGVIPNTEYIPKNLLDSKCQVIVDEYLRVKGVEDVWAAGDLTNLDFAQIIYAEKQASAAAKNLDLVLKGKEPVGYKSGGEGGRMMGLALGRSKATGRSGNMKIPSLVIWWFKGRTLGTEKMPSVVNGSAF